MLSLLKRCYHRLCLVWLGWRIRWELSQLRSLGKRRGLPSLDGYTDEQLLAGLRQAAAIRQSVQPLDEAKIPSEYLQDAN